MIYDCMLGYGRRGEWVSFCVLDGGRFSGIFFFQAEDGIRDWSVTGVQTCALPIYALGLWVSDKLAPFSLSEKELGLVEAGLADGVLKREKKVDLNTFGPKLNELASVRMKAGAEANKKAAQPFLEQAARAEGAQTTASGPGAPLVFEVELLEIVKK